MSNNVWVNADKTAIVGQFGPGKKFQLSRKEAARIGLLTDDSPQPQPRRLPDGILSSTSLTLAQAEVIRDVAPKPRQKRRKSKR